MMRLFLAAVCSLSIATFGRIDDEAAKKHLEALQGKWKAMNVEFDGQPPPGDFVGMLSFTFDKDVMTIDGPMAAEEGKKPEKPAMKITLDPSKTPKTIKVEALNGSKKGETISGIYELEKDELKLCLPNSKDDDAPKEFKTEKGSKHVLFVLKKVKE